MRHVSVARGTEWFVYDELVGDWNSGSRLDRSLSAFVTFAMAWVKRHGRVSLSTPAAGRIRQ